MAASAAALSSPSALTNCVSSKNLFTSISALPDYERPIFAGFLAEFGPKPGDSPEIEDLRTRWALLRYRIDKCQRLDFAAMHQLALQLCQKYKLTFPTNPMELAQIEAGALIEDERGARVLSRLHGHEARLQRELSRTIKEFNALVAKQAEEAAAAQPRDEAMDSDLASFFQDDLEHPQTPRSATCPCGSGLKYKRCCGKDAPPKLNLQ